jgi:NitT/TauT family transport system permease protein
MSTPAAVQVVPRGAVARRVGRRVVDWIPAAIVLVGGLVLWQSAIAVFDIQRFLLPKPTSIAARFWDDRGSLWHAGWFTFQEALGGFAIGCGLAIVLALVVARWRPLGRALMPYAVAANAVPIIAFAPITNAWFSPLGKTSKMAVAAILCFFPVFVNVVRGLTSVQPQSLELMRSYAAGEVEIFRRVRIPTALPFLFSALKVASVLAMIGAIVGEYFGGSLEALGVQIKDSVLESRYEEGWAAILVASILGIGFYLVIAGLERLALSWHPSTRERGSA